MYNIFMLSVDNQILLCIYYFYRVSDVVSNFDFRCVCVNTSFALVIFIRAEVRKLRKPIDEKVLSTKRLIFSRI